MATKTKLVSKPRRFMGFALMVAFLSFSAISGCDDGNDGNTGPAGTDGSDGGFGLEETAITWDYAWFYSGGTHGPYSVDDLNKSEPPATRNGADASCGGPDPITMRECVTDANGLYNVYYGSGYEYPVGNNCNSTGSDGLEIVSGQGDGRVQLINPPSGKVAVLDHNTYGDLRGANCNSGFYDPALGPNDANPWPIRKPEYEKMRDDMVAVLLGCGTKKASDAKGYTTLVTNTNGTQSCVISKEAFSNAGISLPSADGEYPVSNGGIALAWGHGVGHGACTRGGSRRLRISCGAATGVQLHMCECVCTLDMDVVRGVCSGLCEEGD